MPKRFLCSSEHLQKPKQKSVALAGSTARTGQSVPCLTDGEALTVNKDRILFHQFEVTRHSSIEQWPVT